MSEQVSDEQLDRLEALAGENARAVILPMQTPAEQSAIYNRRQDLAHAVPALVAEVRRLRASVETQARRADRAESEIRALHRRARIEEQQR